MTQEYKVCPDCTRAAQLEALVCQRCGHWFKTEHQVTDEEIAARENAERVKRLAIKKKFTEGYLSLARMRTGSMILFVECLLLGAPQIVCVITFFLVVGAYLRGIKFGETAKKRGVSLYDLRNSMQTRIKRETLTATLVIAAATMVLLVLKASPHR
jgi:uncharacterized protein involved in cysteine biosynthesis